DLNNGKEEIISKATSKELPFQQCRMSNGKLLAGFCQESFSTTVTALSEPIDIYSEWIDECERVNNPEDDGA
ncbi:hypothetical protein HN51_031194, partial [Arachis hypogaea]